MAEDKKDIRNFIISKAHSFNDYLVEKGIDQVILDKISKIAGEGSVYLFSGVIRDFFLNAGGPIRDLDFVFQLKDDRFSRYRLYFKGTDVEIRLNSFKGLKVKIEGFPSIDTWELKQTWGIRKSNSHPTINALLESAFFNFSAIAYDIKEKKFIFTEKFVEFLSNKRLDIVLEDNPNIPLCLFNIFYYSKKFDLKVTNRLKNWVKSYYSNNIDFDTVQLHHIGSIIYESKDIHIFLYNLSQMTYGIDWDKYLSPKRFRATTANKLTEGLDKRSPFESDFGRVVFSAPIRRMHDKTQVIPLTSGDHVHTRLTHSMEVMNTAKSLAINLCRDPDFIFEYGEVNAPKLESEITAILMTAGLVHDIGNPPFGHFGETVIKDFFTKYSDASLLKEAERIDFSEFDGNAQGLRVLTHLSYVGDIAGFNLTYGTLGAYMKYPNPDKKNNSYIGTKKHGVYQTEKAIFDKVVENCNLRAGAGNKVKRHPLSFLVEAADSICYLAMDIEDGYNLNWYDKDSLLKYLNARVTHYILDHEKVTGNKLPSSYLKGEKFSFLKIIRKDPNFDDFLDVNPNDWILRFRVSLIQYLVELATANFKKHSHEIEEGIYNDELIEDDEFCVAKVLKDFTSRHILSQPAIQKVELTGHKVITGLLEILIEYSRHSDTSFRNRVKSILSKSALRIAIHEQEYNKTNHDKQSQKKEDYYHLFGLDELHDFDLNKLDSYAKLRLIVDFISGMTDKFAINLYQQLIGIKY